MRLLDIGTFDGDALIVARRKFGIQAFGIEARHQVVDVARNRGLAVSAGVSDRLDPSIFGGSFDLITAFESLEHTADPLDSMRRAHAALVVGGTFMITVPNIDNFEIRQLRELSPHVSGGLIGTGHINLFGVRTLHEALKEANFTVLHTFTQYSSSLAYVAAKVLGRHDTIPNYDAMMKGGAVDLDLEPGALALINLLSTEFYSWETRELKGPILGVIATKRSIAPPRFEFARSIRARLRLGRRHRVVRWFRGLKSSTVD